MYGLLIECQGEKHVVVSTRDLMYHQIAMFLKDKYDTNDFEINKDMSYRYFGDNKGTFKLGNTTGTFERIKVSSC